MAQVPISDESAQLLRELAEGLRTVAGEDRSEAWLVEDAIRRVHRGFYGLPADEQGPDVSTGPFCKKASDRWAEVLIRQVDPKNFRLAQAFRYDDGRRRFVVAEENITDLASVPRFLTWLVPRYGRHTLAALLHDSLQGDPSVSGSEADEIFRDAMARTKVPLARRWLMWSAVAMRTQWHLGGLPRLRAVAFCATFAAAGALLLPALALGLAAGGVGADAVVAASGIALLAPLATCWVFGRGWRLGVVGGYALLAFSFPGALALLSSGVYFGFEWLIERALPRRRRNPILTRNA